jgi:hypothetical protein
MIIEIKEDIFQEGRTRELSFLIQIILYKRRYELFIDIMLVKNNESFNLLSPLDKDEISELYKELGANKVTPNIIISNKNLNNDISILSIDEAIRFLNQTISIVLENSLNDSYFLNAIINNFSKDKRDKINKHLENGWLQYENAGGCDNIVNFIEGKKQSFRFLSNFYQKPEESYLRCFVLMDSDKDFSNQDTKHKKNEDYLIIKKE